MDSCENCALKSSRYCETENKRLYGFCGNFCPNYGADMRGEDE